MVLDWPITALSECAHIRSGGTPPKGETSYWHGDIPWVSAKDMKVFRLHDAQDHVTQVGVANGTRIAPAGSTLVLVRGMTLHDNVPVCWLMRDMAFNQDVKAVVPRQGVEPEYLAYWLAASRGVLHSLVDAAGHGTGRIGGSTLASLPVRLPPRAEQRAIARGLGVIDDKIEINGRVSCTLECIARAIFKSRFIDFDFESQARAERGILSDVATVSGESLDPRELGELEVQHYSIPAFDDGQLPVMEPASRIMSLKRVVLPQCVLVSKLNPSIPRIWRPQPRTDMPALASTEFVVLVPKRPADIVFLHGVVTSEAFTQSLTAMVTGTSGSHQRVQLRDVLRIGVPIPPTSVRDEFSRQVGAMFDLGIQVRAESRTLRQLRDSLLPKLLSGEFAVGAAAASS
jgi:type I restriction enzyme S subunit